MFKSHSGCISCICDGFYLDGDLICTGLGIYWSSSLQIESLESAWSLHFDNVDCHVCGTLSGSPSFDR